MIVNSCGWVDGVGYELLCYSIDHLAIDHVFVIDHERLYNDLQQNYKGTPVEIIKLAKSGGVDFESTFIIF
jgi:polyribonucleotide 5'-hydroxyl-kinase